MRFNDTTVALSAIDAADGAFRITTADDNDRLKQSIRGVGLISPPLLLLNKSAAGCRIIAGYRRVAVCRELGFSRIPARLLPPETPEEACIRLAVADNASQRPLNPIETSRALALLSAWYPEPDALAVAAGELGLPDTPDLIRKLLPLSSLSALLQSAILSGTLSLSMAHTLSRMESGLAASLADLFSDLRLSLNKQREVLTLLQEIGMREDRSIPEILREDPVRSVLSDGESDRNQRAAALRRWLRRRRYPEISRAEAAFSKTLANLPLGDGIQLIPPRHFESPLYTLSLGFKSLPELTDRYRRAGEILSHPDLETLLS